MEPINEKVRGYNVTFTPEPSGGYVVTCAELPGLVTEGDTLEEARTMAADAVDGFHQIVAADRWW